MKIKNLKIKNYRGYCGEIAIDFDEFTALVGKNMVVGQYYMTQINAELGQISDGISKISDFQDDEYRSRVFSLVSQLRQSLSFRWRFLKTMN